MKHVAQSQRCSKPEMIWLMRRARAIAMTVCPWSSDRDALYGAALLGLAEAIQRADPNMGAEDFRKFSSVRMRGAALDENRRLDPLTRDQRKDVLAGKMLSPRTVKVDAAYDVPADENPCEARDTWQHVAAKMAFLPWRLRHVVQRHYLDGESNSVIAEELGITESRVYQLCRDAISNMVTLTSDLHEVRA